MTGSDDAQPVPLHLARRTSPWSIGLEIAAALLGALFVLTTVTATWLLVVSAVFGGLGVVALVLRWLCRTYTVTGERLLLDEGVLRRRHRVVPYARVQQVDVTQRLVHQLVDVAAVRVETAGESGATAVELSVLRRADAEALQAFVLDRNRALSQIIGSSPDTGGTDVDALPDEDVEGSGERREAPRPAAAPQRVLAAMSIGDLLVAGMTRSVVLVVPAVVAGVGLPWVAVAMARGETSLLAGLIAIAVLVIGTIVVAVAVATVSVVATVIDEWEWTLSERGEDLLVRRGLIEVRAQSLPRRRVQRVTVIDNPLRRVVGVHSVALHTAATAGSGHVTTVRVPLVRREELDAFLRTLMGYTWAVPRLLPRSRLARLRAINRRVIVLVVACIGPAAVRPGLAWALAPLVLLGILWGVVAHRRAGLAVTDERVFLASGVMHHRVDIAPRNRIQSTRMSSTPFQRHARLVTLHVDLAGRGLRRRSTRLFDVDAPLATHLFRSLPTRGTPHSGPPRDVPMASAAGAEPEAGENSAARR